MSTKGEPLDKRIQAARKERNRYKRQRTIMAAALRDINNLDTSYDKGLLTAAQKLARQALHECFMQEPL